MYMVKSFFRACNLPKCVKYKDLPGHHEEAKWAAAMAKTALHELEMAMLMAISRLKSRGNQSCSN